MNKDKESITTTEAIHYQAKQKLKKKILHNKLRRLGFTADEIRLMELESKENV